MLHAALGAALAGLHSAIGMQGMDGRGGSREMRREESGREEGSGRE